MARNCLTDEQVEREIEMLQLSPYVALANREKCVRNRRRMYLYHLRQMEKKGRALYDQGITMETLDALCIEDVEIELTTEEQLESPINWTGDVEKVEKCSLSPFGKEIKKKLVDMDKNQSWLQEQVTEKTGLYFDCSYLNKIMTGKRHTPKIVQSIREILDIPETVQTSTV